MHEEQERPEESQEEIYNLYPLLKLVFGEYVAAHELSTEGVEHVTVREFVDWIMTHDYQIPGHDYCRQLGYPETVWDEILNTIKEHDRLPGIEEYWPGFILGCRPAPQHSLGALQAVLVFRYRDGRMVVFSSYTCEELGEVINDGASIHMLGQIFRSWANELSQKSIDKLWEESFDPEEVDAVHADKKAAMPGPPVFPPEIKAKIFKVRAERGLDTKCPPDPAEQGSMRNPLRGGIE